MSKRGRTKKPHKKSPSERGPGQQRAPVSQGAVVASGPPTKRPVAPSILEIVPDPMRDHPVPREIPPAAPVPVQAVASAVETVPAVPAQPATSAETPPNFDLTVATPPDAGTLRATNEEPSVPPASDLDIHFFDAHPTHDPFDIDSDPRAARRAMFAAAAPRRERLAKYVKGAVGGSAVLCVIAILKVALFHGDSAVAPARAASLADPPSHALSLVSPAAAAPNVADPAPSVAPIAAGDPSPAPSADPPAAKAEEPTSAPSGPAEVAAADPAPSPRAAPSPIAAPSPRAAQSPAPVQAAAPAAGDPEARAREASRQREVARAALERGALRDAISAGERSVALDGSDGESWLILGAAYQQRGDLVAARRSYKACVDQGRRGPRSECAQMLR